MSTLSERWQQVQSQLATKDRVHTFYAGATALWDLKLDQFGGRSIRCSMRYGRRHEPKELSRPPERTRHFLRMTPNVREPGRWMGLDTLFGVEPWPRGVVSECRKSQRTARQDRTKCSRRR